MPGVPWTDALSQGSPPRARWWVAPLLQTQALSPFCLPNVLAEKAPGKQRGSSTAKGPGILSVLKAWSWLGISDLSLTPMVQG